MKLLKAIGLAVGAIALCAGFGVFASFVAESSVQAAAKSEVAVQSQQKPLGTLAAVAVETAQEATDMQQ